MSSIGIPIPQKKIIKKNYSGLSSRTAPLTAPGQGKYRSTMLQTPYGDIKILIGPDYKQPSSTMDDMMPITTKGAVDYSKDMIIKSETYEKPEILAEEDSEDSVEALKSLSTVERESSGGAIKYDDLMAVAPEDTILNRYPLAPPKFSGYSSPSSGYPFQRNNHRSSVGSANYAFNPLASYYQNLPLYDPYNYPVPFPQGPMFYGGGY